jgi:type II secretory pathway component GspD/PulD (secretin)
MTALALILGSLISLAPPALADPTPANSFEARLSINIDSGKPADVFASFAQMLGATLEFDPAVTGTVTIRLERVTVRTALNAICESIECRWKLVSEEPARLRVDPRSTHGATVAATAESRSGSPLDEKMSIHLKDAAVGDVLLSFGQILSARLKVDPSLYGGKLTIEMDDAPARTVLDEVCAQARCTWTLSGQDPPVLTLVPIAPAP